MRIMDIPRDEVIKIRYTNEGERNQIHNALAVLGIEIEVLKYTG